MTHRHQSPKQ